MTNAPLKNWSSNYSDVNAFLKANGHHILESVREKHESTVLNGAMGWCFLDLHVLSYKSKCPCKPYCLSLSR